MSTLASLAYFATRSASGALSLATVSVFARLLGPAEYGRWSLLLTLAAFLPGLLLQPLFTAQARLLPAARDDALLATLARALALALLCALLLACLLQALPLAWLPPAWLPPGFALAALVLGAAQGSFDFSAQFLSSTLQARRYGVLYLAKSLLTLALGALLLWRGCGLWGAFGAMLGGYLLASLACAREVWRRALAAAYRSAEMQRLWAYAWPAGLTLLMALLLAWSDRLILAATQPAAVLGAYAAAGDLTVQGFGLIFSALYLAWFPRLVSAWEARASAGAGAAEAAFARYLQLGMLVLVPAAVGFVMVSASLAQVLLGAAYRSEAARLMPWFVATAFVGGIRMYVLDVRLQLAQRLRQLVLGAGVCALASLLANLYLVPRHGALAAVLVGLSAQTLGCLVSAYLGRGVLAVRLPWRDVCGVLLAAAGMAAVLAVLPGGGVAALLLEVCAGALTYALLVYACDVAGLRAGSLRLVHGLQERLRGG